MIENLKLYMLLLGCKPEGRHTEQHDIFFGIGASLKDLIDDINDFWEEANHRIHIDSWREVSCVNGFEIKVVERIFSTNVSKEKLFFLNLGGYKPETFEEFHYKILSVNENKSDAMLQAKQSAFYAHNLSSHIDDKYGVDVDDAYDVEEILPLRIKQKYTLQISSSSNKEDELHIGYVKLNEL